MKSVFFYNDKEIAHFMCLCECDTKITINFKINAEIAQISSQGWTV